MIRQTSNRPLPSQAGRGRRQVLREAFASLLDQVWDIAGGVGASFVIGLTSTGTGEGVTTVATQLARTAAAEGFPTLLVDGHSGRPDISAAFGLGDQPGWRELARGVVELDDCLNATSIDGLTVLPAGGDALVAIEGSENDSPSVESLVSDFQERFALTVFDLPAVEPRGICPALAGSLPGVLLVVQAERSESPAVRRVKERLEARGVRVLGAVFNERRRRWFG